MAPPKPTPLPLAADRAAISNRISLLIASRSSVLKSMGVSSSSTKRTSTASLPATPTYNESDDEDLFRGATGSRPNEGVGYIPDKAQTKKDAVSKEDRMLRGRILGKRKADGSSTGRGNKNDDSDQDDEPGRSSLGKRKRPRKSAADTVTTEEPVVPPSLDDNDDESDNGMEKDQSNARVDGEAISELGQEPTASTGPEGSAQQESPGPMKKKGKKKKRKKRKPDNGQGTAA